MSDLGFTRSDLCSICAAVGLAEYADAVRRGLLSAGAFPLTGDDPLAAMTGVLHISGCLDRRATGGARPMTSRRGQRTGAGR